MPRDSEDSDDDDSFFRRPRPLHTENPRDRDPGILTYDDRKYLFGEKKASEGTEAQLRQRLRDRIRNGLLDFEILLYCLDDRDVQTIFSEISGPTQMVDSPAREVRDGVLSTLAFIYFGVTEFSHDQFDELLEDAIETSSRRSSERRDGHHQWRADADVNINVNWEVHAWRNDKLMEKLRNGDPLTDRELGMIIRYGDLDDEDWQRIRGEIAEGPPPGLDDPSESEADDGESTDE
jgi:hypothetical protein